MRACWLGEVKAYMVLWSGAHVAGVVSDTVSATVSVIAAAVAVVIAARFH